jgi:transcriptional regulator with XRE-family HTH domain
VTQKGAQDGDVHGELNSLGARLRSLRADRHLSLSTVSAGCSISSSMLSQVERGLVVPSLNTLYSLSSFYQIGLFELFLDEPRTEAGQVVRKGERRRVSFPGSNESYELISPANQNAMSVFELLIKPDRGQFEHGLAHAGQECTLVLEGVVSIDLGGEQHLLHPGDSIYYDAVTSHQFVCAGPESVRLVVMVTPAI